MIQIRVDGDPKGQPRARAFAINGKIRMYDPSTAEGWKSAIAAAAMPHRPETPLDGPVRVDETFLFARPKRLLRKKDPEDRIPHTAKPDRDNLDKAVLDSLTQMGWWKDDAYVYAGTIEKYYVAKGERPGLVLTITEGTQ